MITLESENQKESQPLVSVTQEMFQEVFRNNWFLPNKQARKKFVSQKSIY